ncbi:beta-L-arabinofuranosidase domain-containing protein [Aquimarina celericrescens]|uniref:Beta-L-arabinofuranosidase domain-containing protein n=1 Tax=Aquimarina celericrescens TaxID=1964542 RepID=A0ABW5AX55_9FLAO|nr:glycoside hydrolase family 127 protein [Aquimarina celericrescens]
MKIRIAVILSMSFMIQACAQKSTLPLDLEYKEKIVKSLNQAIQHTSEAMIDEHGMAKGNYHIISGEWKEYEAAWHTGQAIYGLLEAYEVTGNQKALDVAIRAGNWWVGLQFPKGHKLEGYLNAKHGNKLGDLINTTTIADGTPGLFNLTDMTNDKTYADVATSAGAWILDHLYIPEERLSYNIVDGKTGEVWKDRSPHAQHQGLPLTIKHVARPNAEGYLWRDMYTHTGEERYKKAFLEICNKLVDDQSENGWWMDFEPNDPETGKIHGRFNTWNAEALIEAYTLTNEQKYLDAAVKTARALAGVQDRTGVIWYSSYLDSNHDKRSPCGSAASFAGILWLQLYELGITDFEENIKRALDFTLKNQFSENHKDPNLAGAYYEIRQRAKKDGTFQLYYRDIATSFGMRFLSDVYQSAYQ